MLLPVADLTTVVARQRAAIAELSKKVNEYEHGQRGDQDFRDRLGNILESEMELSVQRATISREIAHGLTRQILSRYVRVCVRVRVRFNTLIGVWLVW